MGLLHAQLAADSAQQPKIRSVRPRAEPTVERRACSITGLAKVP